MAEYMRRFATGLDTYEFAEVRSDDFADFVEAAANLADHVGASATTKAVTSVKQTFGNVTEAKPETSAFGAKKSFGGGGASTEAGPDKIELGTHEGYRIEVNVKGQFAKYGPNVAGWNPDSKDRLKAAKLPQGMDPTEVTLEQAVALLAEKN